MKAASYHIVTYKNNVDPNLYNRLTDFSLVSFIIPGR